MRFPSAWAAALRSAAVCAIAVAAAACAFDPSGAADPADASRSDAVDAAPPDASGADPDASGPDADAEPPCRDGDGDGFLAPSRPGEVCDPVDCDDEDARVHPGQTGAFTSPKRSGDFDYNCDGVEEPVVDTTLGGPCEQPVFGPCGGTGWLDAVPSCGQVGTWHRCEAGLFSCDETERAEAIMPCR
ncbi:MAG: hypothetical protein D6689_13995 [Deltaproteobacteria bacterium]|nr:MAG: hypothetical protein D6689_13995 [Deltaproteobacteria bacterium]